MNRFPSLQKIRPKLAFVFHEKLATIFKQVFVAQPVIGGFVDLYMAWSAVGFHLPGGVDSFAPDVVAEFGLADDAGHHRTGVDSDAQAEGLFVNRVVPRDFLL